MTAGRAPAGRNTPLGLAAFSAAVIVWACGPLIVSEMNADTWAVLFWRLWAAQPITLGMAALGGHPLTLKVLRRVWFPGVVFGGSFITSFASFRWTSIANATLIGALTPLLVFAVTWVVFGQRPSTRLLVLGSIALAGIVMVVVGADTGGVSSRHGDLAAAGSLLCFTFYFMKTKKIRDEGMPTSTYIAGVFLISALVVTPFSLAFSHDIGGLDHKDWVLIGLMLLGPGLLGHGLGTWAQPHLRLTTSSLMMLGGPALSTLLSWAIQHQRINGWQLLGVAVVLGALALVVVRGGVIERPNRPTALSVAEGAG